MRFKEILEAAKRRRRRTKNALWGPGPYGGYGYSAGYSGDGGDGGSVGEDQHPNEKPRGPEIKPTMPKGTLRIDVSDVYDWYKLGQHISNLKGLGRHDFGKGPPATIISFGSEEEEHKFIQALKQIGLDITDIDPAYHDKKQGVKTDPTYNVENFADGKKPSRKGLAKRQGVDCGKSVTDLRRIAANSSGERQRMAHWCANMKSGRNK